MKDKIVNGLFSACKFLLYVIGLIVAVAIVLAYHFGIPYLFYKFLNSGDTDYTFYLAVWFAVSYLMEVWDKRNVKKQLKQYKEIDDILKGRI